MVECRITDAIKVHVYEVRPRKDKRGVDLMSDVLPLVAYGTTDRMQSATQSDMRSIAAAHIMRQSGSDTRPHPTNIDPHIMKRLFHCKDCADDYCFHLILVSFHCFGLFLMSHRESSFLAVH